MALESECDSRILLSGLEKIFLLCLIYKDIYSLEMYYEELLIV